MTPLYSVGDRVWTQDSRGNSCISEVVGFTSNGEPVFECRDLTHEN